MVYEDGDIDAMVTQPVSISKLVLMTIRDCQITLVIISSRNIQEGLLMKELVR